MEVGHAGGSDGLSLESREWAEGSARIVAARITNRAAVPFTGCFRLVYDLPGDFRANYFMVPGFLHGENRPAANASDLYPRYDPDRQIPRDMTSNRWDFAADRTASPLVFAHDGRRGLALAVLPHYRAGPGMTSTDCERQCGIGFGPGYLRVNIPAREEPFTYTGTGETGPTLHEIAIPPGGTVEAECYLYDCPGPRQVYARIVEDYYRRMTPRYPAAPEPDGEAIRGAVEAGLMAHYHPDGYFIYSRPYFPVVEQIANARGICGEWHQMNVGFVNGFPVCLALLKTGRSPEAEQAAVRVADRFCTEGISPSGLFWTDYMPRTIRTDNGDFPNPLYGANRHGEWGGGWLANQRHLHARTIADGCLSLAKMIALRPTPLWEKALRGNLEVVLAKQAADGNFGQCHDAGAGDVVKDRGCGGLLWIPALLRAGSIFGNDGPFVEKARRAVLAAGDYYAHYVESDNIWGAPEDNDSPTSEDGMNAVIAYVELYEATRASRFLDLARRAADWMLTFRKTYNVDMPEKSIMGAYGMRSRGGDFASASNNHLHIFEVLCGRHLRLLSEWTGNDYYRRRADDHWRFACQHISLCDGMFSGFYGAAAEQFYWTNWMSIGDWRKPGFYRPKGSAALYTAVWCIAALGLGLAEMRDGR